MPVTDPTAEVLPQQARVPSLEDLDQEITLQLQKIDSNLSYCFKKITKEIIPTVTKYGDVCDQTLNSCNWLKDMFHKSADIQLLSEPPLSQASKKQPTHNTHTIPGTSATVAPTKDPESLFPTSMKQNHTKYIVPQLQSSLPPLPALKLTHDENITTTGQILKIPLSSDDDDNNQPRAMDSDDEHDPNDDGSTIQKQRKKRKLSLMLQQRYGSSSSASFISRSPTLYRTLPRPADNPTSSPIKQSTETSSTGPQRESSRPTVIHFSTK